MHELSLADLRALEKLPEVPYGLPSLSGDLNFVKKSILVDGKVVGSAIAHLTSEVSLMLDPALSNLAKAKILKEVFTVMLREIKEAGLEDTHVFVLPESDTHYEKFLKKHFNFVKASGIPLYLYPR